MHLLALGVINHFGLHSVGVHVVGARLLLDEALLVADHALLPHRRVHLRLATVFALDQLLHHRLHFLLVHLLALADLLHHNLDGLAALLILAVVRQVHRLLDRLRSLHAEVVLKHFAILLDLTDLLVFVDQMQQQLGVLLHNGLAGLVAGRKLRVKHANVPFRISHPQADRGNLHL